jgi:hypothetical protein
MIGFWINQRHHKNTIKNKKIMLQTLKFHQVSDVLESCILLQTLPDYKEQAGVTLFRMYVYSTERRRFAWIYIDKCLTISNLRYSQADCFQCIQMHLRFFPSPKTLS